MIDRQLLSVISGFDIHGEPVDAAEIRTGHINNTYRLTFRQPDRRYLLQRINTFAFHRPDEVMENVLRVTEHLRGALLARGLDPAGRVLRVIPSKGGAPLCYDAQGGAWRAYDFIENAHSVNTVDSPEQFREVGRGFGDFQSMLSDFPIEVLHDTIPHFHDTPRRVRNFEASAAADPKGRAAGAAEEIAFARARAEAMGEIVRMLDRGEIPLRVTHNDTKCNNVMVDDATGEALCVVDLDTVMAGSALYDYGDAIRFGASAAAEDERDLSRVRLDMALFTAFTEGYLERTAGGLTRAELDHLALGALVMTYEVGLRFLTDYLDGDVYFHTDTPDHNLVRARAQFRLLSDMENHRDEMEAIVRRLTPQGGA